MPPSRYGRSTTPGRLPEVGPTTAAERVHALDALRGFALLGVIVANVAITRDPSGWADRAVAWFESELVTGRFYTLFAFLFGLGFSLQLQRAQDRGTDVTPLYLRRVAILFAIGIAHAALIFPGDILASYAVMSVPLLFLHRLSTRVLLGLVVLSLLLPAAILFGLDPILGLRAGPIDRAAAERVLATGTWVEVTVQRFGLFTHRYHQVWWNELPGTFALFLVGFVAGRAGFTARLGDVRLLRRVAVWGLVLFAFGAALDYAVRAHWPPPPGGSFWRFTTRAIVRPLHIWPQMLLYVSALLLLWRHGRWADRLTPLAAVGRMALTNYLLASLFLTTAYYGYGLGLYRQLGNTQTLVFSLAIVACELAFSTWWLRRYRFGPAEWAWRSLTYGRAQPMRVRVAVTATP